jgi:nicotinamidase-related amidase
LTCVSEPAPLIDPSHTALLVMDYQPGLLGSLPDGAALVGRAQAALALARSSGVTVGYVRVALTDAEAAAVPPANKGFSAAAAARRLPEGSPDSQVDGRVAPQPGDIVVRKVRVGAFSTTDLDTQLRERGIDTLILAGISTSGVVLSTVRDGADRDYRLYVLADLCADRDLVTHDVLLGHVFPRQAYVITSADLPGLLAIG